MSEVRILLAEVLWLRAVLPQSSCMLDRGSSPNREAKRLLKISDGIHQLLHRASKKSAVPHTRKRMTQAMEKVIQRLATLA
ncbi:unnamed protein product [Dibothriocephalus latus]|uniref:Uncharacterized protein n=1 Tax=Dibothriocephalus latus TaxID=60516 RepID=A0A3P6T5G6_DIBLA|nr:unnamed protein product [Dibothriocephalus latus]